MGVFDYLKAMDPVKWEEEINKKLEFDLQQINHRKSFRQNYDPTNDTIDALLIYERDMMKAHKAMAEM